MKLSAGQEKAGSEMLGNISVAWFTASVIAPFFLPKISLEETAISLLLVKNIKR